MKTTRSINPTTRAPLTHALGVPLKKPFEPVKYMGRTILLTSSLHAKGKYYVARNNHVGDDGEPMALDESLCSQYPSIATAKEAIKNGDAR